MRLFLCFVIFILSSQKILSQDENNSTYFKIEGDSIYKKEIDLSEVVIYKPVEFKNNQERIDYFVLKRKVLKVYPYAKMASERLTKLNLRLEKINYLLSKFELENVKDIKAKFLSGGQRKKLVIALSLLSDPKVLLLDECFAALDVLTIKMLQEIIVNLQQETRITICICDHQARDLLACVDIAMILSNCKIIAQDSPGNLVNNINAKNAYFGESFKIN